MGRQKKRKATPTDLLAAQPPEPPPSAQLPPEDDDEDFGEPVVEDGGQTLEQASPPPPDPAPTPPPPPEAAAPSSRAADGGSSAAVAKDGPTAAPERRELDAMALGLVEVRDTGSAKGMGLFAREALEDNTWLGDYEGEVLTQAQYLRRYPNEDAQYVLAANTDYNIDAADPAKSSFLRFANHSSDFNIFYDVLRVRGKREKHVKFYTARAVAAGEELVFDYGRQYWSERGFQPV